MLSRDALCLFNRIAILSKVFAGWFKRSSSICLWAFKFYSCENSRILNSFRMLNRHDLWSVEKIEFVEKLFNWMKNDRYEWKKKILLWYFYSFLSISLKRFYNSNLTQFESFYRFNAKEKKNFNIFFNLSLYLFINTI